MATNSMAVHSAQALKACCSSTAQPRCFVKCVKTVGTVSLTDQMSTTYVHNVYACLPSLTSLVETREVNMCIGQRLLICAPAPETGQD